MTPHLKHRRQFILGSAAAIAGASIPGLGRAQNTAVKLGVVHPMTGPVAYNGQHCRIGTLTAIEDLNARGGIKSLGGIPFQAVTGDSQGRVEVGVSEVERMHNLGVHAYVGCYNSPVTIAATQAASRYGTPFVVDVGASDLIVSRKLENVFRFSPGFGKCVDDGLLALTEINKKANGVAKTVVLVHESGELGTGTIRLLQDKLPRLGFTVLDTIAHDTPTRSFDNVALRIRGMKPDIVMHTGYVNEYMLLARTLQRYKVPAVRYSILGAGFGVKFAKESPDAAAYAMDFNHWYNPLDSRAVDLKKRIESKGFDYVFEVYCAYNAVMLLADAIERSGSLAADKIIQSLSASTWDKHFMPYGPTRFVNGQNEGAAGCGLQVINDEINVVFPDKFAQATAVFPRPAS